MNANIEPRRRLSPGADARGAGSLPGTAHPASPAATWFAFTLFLFANAILYVRPTEYLGDVLGQRVFLVLMGLCLLVGFPAILTRFSLPGANTDPLLWLPMLLWGIIVVSNLGVGRPLQALDGLLEFGKVMAYYLLLLGLTTTTGRLKQLLWWLPWFAFVITLIAVLQYHEVIKLDLFKQLQDNDIKRLRATGIFRDPNDLGVLLVVAVICSLYFLFRDGLFQAPLWLGLIGLFLYAIYLTHSRGTLLGLGIALFILIRARIGTIPALMLGSMLLPGLLLLSGRGVDVSDRDDTAMSRIGLWSDAMVEFTASPLFGTGFGNLVENMGMMAHNSYMHAFAELGFPGGCVFLGMFIWALWTMLTLTANHRRIIDPHLADLHPTMTALLAGFMVCIFSLSLCYVHPTFTVLGLIGAYLHLTATRPARPRTVMNDRFFLWLGLLGALFLVFMKVFIPFMRVLGG